MLRLRRLASEVVSDATANRTDGVADAGAGVILSAICAMKVPSPIMIAAKIIMLRITPLSIAGSPHKPTPSRSRQNIDRRHVTRRAILAKRMSEGLTWLLPARAGAREKKPSRPLGFDAAGRHCARRILRPGMARIASAQIRAHARIAAAPEARQIARHLHWTVRRRQQLQHQRNRRSRNRGMAGQPEQFLQPHRNGWPLLGLVVDRELRARRRLEMRRRFPIEPRTQGPRQ